MNSELNRLNNIELSITPVPWITALGVAAPAQHQHEPKWPALALRPMVPRLPWCGWKRGILVNLASSAPGTTVIANTIVTAVTAGRTLVDVIILPELGHSIRASVCPNTVAADSQLSTTAIAAAAVVDAFALRQEGVIRSHRIHAPGFDGGEKFVSRFSSGVGVGAQAKEKDGGDSRETHDCGKIYLELGELAKRTE